MQMKTFLKNKKVLAGFLALVLLLSGLISAFGFDHVIAYAIGSESIGSETIKSSVEGEEKGPETKDQATPTKVEVLVKYLFEDKTIFKEEKLSADIGSIIDAGDLPMLPDDMEFIDDFLFYEVKESDNLIERIVAKVAENETQVEEQEVEPDEQEAQPEEPETVDEGTQTEISNEDIINLEEKSEELSQEVEQLKEDLGKSEKVSKEQEEKIEALEKEKADLTKELEEAKKLTDEANKKEESDQHKAYLEQVKALEEKLADIDKTLQETNQIIKENKSSSNLVNQNQGKETSQVKQMEQAKPTQDTNPIQQVTPIQPTLSSVQSQTKEASKNEVQDIEKPKSALVDNSSVENKEEDNQVKDTKGEMKSPSITEIKEKETEIRYPNKLTPKQPINSTSSSDMSGDNQPINTNKGVASDPSKARASVTENVDNANNDFPIHHGREEEAQEVSEHLPYYSADARQFVTFTTKNGKTFHLIINHDEESENVMLLTEVSEDDLLNMVETKKKPVIEEPVKIEEPEPVVEEPIKEEEPSNAGTYLLVGLVIAGVLGAGYYFKVVKAKENDELAGFEEDDEDYYYSEAEDGYVGSSEEDSDNEEEDIDSEDLL